MATNVEDVEQAGANKSALEELQVLIYTEKSGKVLSQCSSNDFWCRAPQLRQCSPSFPHFWAKVMSRTPDMLEVTKQLPVCQLEAKIASSAGPAGVILLFRLASEPGSFPKDMCSGLALTGSMLHSISPLTGM